jgi:hypothetical protein
MGPSESHTTLELARKRIADIAVQHEVPAPMHLQEGDDAPIAEVLQFREQTGVSLDYLFFDE